MKAGAQTNIENHNNGYTLLHTAVLINNISIVDTLLRLCPKLDMGDIDGNFPIHLADEAGCIGIVNHLLDNKHIINAKNQRGFTSLHLAAQNGHEKVVKILICGGVDLDIQDEEGNTALIMATEANHIEIVKLLSHRRADYKIPNNAGMAFGAFATSEKMISIVNQFNNMPDISLFDMPKTHKVLSNISNVSSSESSNKSHILKYRIDQTSHISSYIDSSMLYATTSLTQKRKRLSGSGIRSSSESSGEACTSKRSKATDRSILVYRCKLDNSTSTSISNFCRYTRYKFSWI